MLLRAVPVLIFCLGVLQAESLLAQTPATGQTLTSANTQTSPAGALAIQVQGSGPYYRLAIPITANAASQYSDLRDLQVQNAAGLPVPYAWIGGEVLASEMASARAPIFALPPSKEEASSVNRDTPIGLKLGADGSVRLSAAPLSTSTAGVQQWIVDTHKISGSIVQLRLALSANASGLFSVNVESSNDLIRWESSINQGQIARLKAGGSLIERLELELPSVRAKYLRISTQAGAPTLPLSGVMVDSVRRADAVAQLEWSAAINPARCEATYCEYILPRNVPLSSLRMALSQTNTLSPVTITGLRSSAPANAALASQHRQTNPLRLLRHKSKDGASPAPASSQIQDQVPVANTVLYRLSAATGEVVSPDIALDGDSYTAIRLNVANNVQLLGVPAPSIRVGSYTRSLLFLAQGAGPYRVTWLEPKGKTFSLPLSTLIPNYKAGQMIEADKATIRLDSSPPDVRAAAEKSRSASMAANASVETAGNSKPWLWGALGLALTLLAGMAYSLFSSFKKSDTGQKTADTIS